MRNEKEIEKAVAFLVTHIYAYCHNPKPVLLHSIRVAMYLYHYDYADELVIIALLHDLLEDTDVLYSDIEKVFGQEVADIVQSLTFRTDIADKMERWKDEEDRALAKGKKALIVKTADFIDNMDYYTPLEYQGAALPYPLDKAQYFITHAQNSMQHEPIWQDILDKFSLLTRQYGESCVSNS